MRKCRGCGVPVWINRDAYYCSYACLWETQYLRAKRRSRCENCRTLLPFGQFKCFEECYPRFLKRGGQAPEYAPWTSIKMRCFNPNATGYKYYGGRGITMCERWRRSFSAFRADMGPRPSMAHSVDRIDNDGNYEPGNCRWATYKQQAKNKRRRAA